MIYRSVMLFFGLWAILFCLGGALPFAAACGMIMALIWVVRGK